MWPHLLGDRKYREQVVRWRERQVTPQTRCRSKCPTSRGLIWRWVRGGMSRVYCFNEVCETPSSWRASQWTRHPDSTTTTLDRSPCLTLGSITTDISTWTTLWFFLDHITSACKIGCFLGYIMVVEYILDIPFGCFVDNLVFLGLLLYFFQAHHLLLYL